jgi:hypothetical protein
MRGRILVLFIVDVVLCVTKIPRVGALDDSPIWPHRGRAPARWAVYVRQGPTTGGNPVQAGPPLPVLKL